MLSDKVFYAFIILLMIFGVFGTLGYLLYKAENAIIIATATPTVLNICEQIATEIAKGTP